MLDLEHRTLSKQNSTKIVKKNTSKKLREQKNQMIAQAYSMSKVPAVNADEKRNSSRNITSRKTNLSNSLANRNLSGRSFGKSKDVNKQSSERENSRRSGNYIRIGAVLGNVNIIHQNSTDSLDNNKDEIQVQNMALDSQNMRKNASQAFDPYDQRT